MEVINLKSKNFEQRGVKLGDTLEIFPVFGRKKKLVLNRINYDFVTQKTESLRQENCSFVLPQISTSSVKVQIQLCELAPGGELEKSGRFVISSNSPFKLNGSYVLNAVLEIGDEILIGYNKLVFKQSYVKDEISFPLKKVICESPIPVLITGETGCGKTHLAKEIHERSGVAGRFVHINISSFSKSLIESELFGHVKGAFTGATSDRLGALQEASGGTLFLDEIDSLPYEIQTKLLLFLDSGVVRPVGARREYKSQVRLICASGQDLKGLIDRERMRKDFYFRISSGFKHNVLSLRHDRKRIRSFCEAYALDQNISISERLIRFYMKKEWPGNIRELKFHLDKKIALTKSSFLDFDSFDEEIGKDHFNSLTLNHSFITIDSLKEQYIKKVYFQSNGSIKECENILGVSDNTIRSYLRRSRLIGK